MTRSHGKVLAVAEATDGSYVRFADGRTMGDVAVVADDEMIEAMRQGYVCIRCFEPTGDAGAFPERCPSALPNGHMWCNFPMKELQAKEFARDYGGEVHVGSRINKADEFARMREMDEYESRTGIVLPDHVKFPNGTI